MTDLVSVVMPCYEDAHLVERSVPRILERTRVPLELVLVNNDTAQSDHIQRFVGGLGDSRVHLIELDHGAGFARAVNVGIRAASSELVFFANSDLFVGDRYLDELVSFFSRRPRAACATGKLLRYDLAADEETNVIDSTGHVIGRSRRVVDRGENERDVGQFEREEEIFSVSGAALVARRRALESVAVRGEYLDESFGSYKEDIDLCWRFRLAGWECWYVPSALAYHGRKSHGLAGQSYIGSPAAFLRNERLKPQHVRANSMKNQWLMLVKNEDASTFAKDLPHILGRELLVLGHNLLFAPRETMRVLGAVVMAAPDAFARRRIIGRRAPAARKDVSRWFGHELTDGAVATAQLR